MGLIKLALEKKAIDPSSVMHGLLHGGWGALEYMGAQYSHVPTMVQHVLEAAGAGVGVGGAIRTATRVIVGSSLNKLPKIITRPGNFIGKSIGRSTLADAIIAARQGASGKGIDSTRPLAMWLGGNPETQAKTYALHQFNESIAKTPFAGTLFHPDRPNLLDVPRLKQNLSDLPKLEANLHARADEVHSKMIAGALRSGNKRGLKGLDLQTHIQKLTDKANTRRDFLKAPITNIIDRGKVLHEHLSLNEGYGYNLLEEAAKKAETSMNRPDWMNYTKRIYSPVKELETNKLSLKNFKAPFTIGKRSWEVVEGQHVGIEKGLSFKEKAKRAFEYMKSGHPDESKHGDLWNAMNERRHAETTIVGGINDAGFANPAIKTVAKSEPVTQLKGRPVAPMVNKREVTKFLQSDQMMPKLLEESGKPLPEKMKAPSQSTIAGYGKKALGYLGLG